MVWSSLILVQIKQFCLKNRKHIFTMSMNVKRDWSEWGSVTCRIVKIGWCNKTMSRNTGVNQQQNSLNCKCLYSRLAKLESRPQPNWGLWLTWDSCSQKDSQKYQWTKTGLEKWSKIPPVRLGSYRKHLVEIINATGWSTYYWMQEFTKIFYPGLWI